MFRSCIFCFLFANRSGDIGMLKVFLLSMMLILNFLGTAFAQTVTVTGVGTDKASAIRDATRLAVEQVAGTYIDSRTLMQDLIIQLDEVYKTSHGFVENIDILEEGFDGSENYYIRATINVDTDPNSELISKLTMIMQLNDPRIAVVAFDGDSVRNNLVESSLIERLLDSGFSHVIENDALDLEDPNSIQSFKNLNGIDYLVSCRCSKFSRPVTIPDHLNHVLKETPFTSVKSHFRVNVIKYDTGEFIGSFEVDGVGVENSETLAEIYAVSKASEKAANKLVDTFRNFSASTTQNLSFTIIASDNSKIEKIIEELHFIGQIDNVYIREISDGNAVLAIDSAQKPYEIVTILKNRSQFSIVIENMTNNSCKLKIT